MEMSEFVTWFFIRSWIVSLQVLWVFVCINILAKLCHVPAKIVYVVLCILLIRLCIPFHYVLITDDISNNIVFPVVDAKIITSLNTISPSVSTSINEEYAVNMHFNYQTIIVIIWSFVVIFGMLIFLLKMEKERRKVRSYEKVQRQDIVDLLQTLLKQMHIKQFVNLAISEKGPCLTGVGKKTILLPEMIASEWNTENIKPILVHELIHISRRDVHFNFMQNIIQIIFFFHPIVWLLNISIRKWRELACDEMATKILSKKHYCSIMLKIATFNLKCPCIFSEPALFYKKTFLEKRIKIMLFHHKISQNVSYFLALLALLLITSTLVAQSQEVHKYRFENKISKASILENILLKVPGVKTVSIKSSYIQVLCTSESARKIESILEGYKKINELYASDIIIIKEPVQNNDKKFSFSSISQKSKYWQELRQKNNKNILYSPRLTTRHGQIAQISVLNDKPYVEKFEFEKSGNERIAHPVINNIKEGIIIQTVIIKDNHDQKYYIKFSIKITEFQGFEDARQQLPNDFKFENDYVNIQIPKVYTWEKEQEIIVSSLPTTIQSTVFTTGSDNSNKKSWRIIANIRYYKK